MDILFFVKHKLATNDKIVFVNMLTILPFSLHFEQINAVLVSIRNFFQNHFFLKTSPTPKFCTVVYTKTLILINLQMFGYLN